MDVSEPEAPKHLKDTHFEGVKVSSRLLDDKLHLVMQFLPILPSLELLDDGTEAGHAAVVQKNKILLEAIGLDDLLSKYEVRSETGEVIESGELLTYDEFSRPFEPGGGSIVNIVTFDLENPDLPFWAVGLVADIHTIYASQKSLFLAATRWNPRIRPNDTTRPQHDFRQKTVIHQFDLTTPRVKPVASGEDRGYLVTVVQIDPLFTLDLSDPTAPKIAGELSVPGFSTYIHPFGRDHLITLGRNGSHVQLSIFDVTDFENPVLAHTARIGDADRFWHSEALYEPKAFTFWQEENLLALPASLAGRERQNALYVYHVTKDSGFESLGQTKLSDLSRWTRGVFIEKDVYALQEDRISSAKVDDIQNTVRTLDIREVSGHPLR